MIMLIFPSSFFLLPLIPGFWVLGSGFWVLGSGFWVLGSGFWVLGSGFWVLGSGFWVLGSGFWVLVHALGELCVLCESQSQILFILSIHVLILITIKITITTIYFVPFVDPITIQPSAFSLQPLDPSVSSVISVVNPSPLITD